MYECFRTALEDIVHDVGQGFSLGCWFGLLVRVRRIGVAVVAIVVVGGACCCHWWLMVGCSG